MIRVKRSDFLVKDNLDLLQDINNADLSDTSFTDNSAIDPDIIPYSYSVELYGEHNSSQVYPLV